MKLLYEQENNKYKIYGDTFNYPLIWCIYLDEDNKLTYAAGFETKQKAWDYWKANYKL